MNINEPTFTSESGQNWHLLGELESQTGTGTNSSIQSWLLEISDPLNLPMDFLNRIMTTIQDSVSRGGLEADAVQKIGCIHVCIFVSHGLVSKGKNWGFFHTEKSSGPKNENTSSFDHRMDIYLYTEEEN